MPLLPGDLVDLRTESGRVQVHHTEALAARQVIMLVRGVAHHVAWPTIHRHASQRVQSIQQVERAIHRRATDSQGSELVDQHGGRKRVKPRSDKPGGD